MGSSGRWQSRASRSASWSAPRAPGRPSRAAAAGGGRHGPFDRTEDAARWRDCWGMTSALVRSAPAPGTRACDRPRPVALDREAPLGEGPGQGRRDDHGPARVDARSAAAGTIAGRQPIAAPDAARGGPSSRTSSASPTLLGLEASAVWRGVRSPSTGSAHPSSRSVTPRRSSLSSITACRHPALNRRTGGVDHFGLGYGCGLRAH